jgi:hypothetical protein
MKFNVKWQQVVSNASELIHSYDGESLQIEADSPKKAEELALLEAQKKINEKFPDKNYSRVLPQIETLTDENGIVYEKVEIALPTPAVDNAIRNSYGHSGAYESFIEKVWIAKEKKEATHVR